jgi:hypothetical protein
MDDGSAQIVQEQIRRTGRSLLQYVADAVPWTGNEDRGALGRIAQLTQEEREALACLARLLRRNHVPVPFLGPYPEHFTTLNYLSLDGLLPLLVEDGRRSVAGLEAAVAEVADPAARAVLTDALEAKRRHLAALTELTKTHPHVGVRV